MSGLASIGGRFGVGVAFALSIALAVPAMADGPETDDDFVGWPRRSTEKPGTGKPGNENSGSIEREILGEEQPTSLPSLPQRSEVTEKALAAWSVSAVPAGKVETAGLPADPPPESPLDVRSAAAPTFLASPEIAPLKRITPPVRHELILYAPGDFSISVATAERLDQMAMRLRGTRDRISIIAHSGSLAGNAQISTHEAVKLSFKRAMLVRLYLIEEGVSPDQIDLQALPRANDGGPEDRVEISPASKAARR